MSVLVPSVLEIAGTEHKLCLEVLLSLPSILAHSFGVQLSLMYFERDAAGSAHNTTLFYTTSLFGLAPMVGRDRM